MKHHKHQSIRQPEYPGGNKALTDFIKSKLRYPKERIADQIKGVVRVKADIDKSGKVIRTKVVAGLGPEFDQEAQRVVKLLKFLVPENRDIRVTYHKQFNVGFNPPALPKRSESKSEPSPNKQQRGGLQITYHYTPKKDS